MVKWSFSLYLILSWVHVRLMKLVSPHFSMSPGSLQRQRPPAALLQTLQHYWSAEMRGQGPGTGRWHENQGPLMSWVWQISSQHWDSRPIRGLGETCARLCQAVSVWARDIFAIVAVSESGLQQSVLQYCSALLTAVHSAGVGEGSTTCAQWLSARCHLLPIWWQ